MGPTSFGAAGVATLRQWRREQVYGNEAPPPPRPLCRARPPAREARERGAGLGAAAIAAAAAGTRGTSGRWGGAVGSSRGRAVVRVLSSGRAGGLSRGGEGHSEDLGAAGPRARGPRGRRGRRWREPGVPVEARRQPVVVWVTWRGPDLGIGGSRGAWERAAPGSGEASRSRPLGAQK